MAKHAIEHLGIVVNDSESMALWYQDNLDFEILRSFPTDGGHVAFIRDGSGSLIFELISNEHMPSIEPAITHPLQFHIAITSEDIEADKQRLIDAGGSFVMNCSVPEPALVLIVADPWGNNNQLAQRKEDFYNP